MSQWFDEFIEEERQEARREGYEEGRKEGREMAILHAIQDVANNLKLTVEQAMDILDIQTEDRPHYRSRL